MQNEGAHMHLLSNLQIPQASEDWGVCTLLVALEEILAAKAGWGEDPTEIPSTLGLEAGSPLNE